MIVGNKCLEIIIFSHFCITFRSKCVYFQHNLRFKCVCVETQGKKKIFPVKRFSVFSNRIVYIQSVNR